MLVAHGVLKTEHHTQTTHTDGQEGETVLSKSYHLKDLMSVLSIKVSLGVSLLTWGHVIWDSEQTCGPPWESEHCLHFFHTALPATPKKRTAVAQTL